MSGDSCEKHGWWEVNGQDACPSCEITLLRAEVAILAQEAQKVVDNHEEGFSCQDGVAQDLPKLLKNLPVEARALLDRLHALEVSVNLLQ